MTNKKTIDWKCPNMDFSSLYPNVMNIFPNGEYEELLRKRNRQKLLNERRRKLENLNNL